MVRLQIGQINGRTKRSTEINVADISDNSNNGDVGWPIVFGIQA
jgi:hypothetical protein